MKKKSREKKNQTWFFDILFIIVFFDIFFFHILCKSDLQKRSGTWHIASVFVTAPRHCSVFSLAPKYSCSELSSIKEINKSHFTSFWKSMKQKNLHMQIINNEIKHDWSPYPLYNYTVHDKSEPMTKGKTDNDCAVTLSTSRRSILFN